MRLSSKAIVVFILACVWWGTAVPQTASAHAYLQRSDPADGAVLATAPTDVNLWFDEPIAPDFSAIQVFDINSQPVSVTHIRTNPDDPYHLAFSFPDELSPGVYSIRWKALSEADGHFSLGMLVFGVGAETDLNSANLMTNETPPPEATEVGLRWLNFTLLAVMMGSVLVGHFVIRPYRADAAIRPFLETAQNRVVHLAGWAALLLLLVGLGLLGWQVRQLLTTLPDSVSIPAAAWQIVSRTRWGLLWNGRQLLLLLLVVSLFSLRRFSLAHLLPRLRFVWGIVGLLLLALFVLQSSMGHAAAAAPYTFVSILFDALHLLAAAAWVGSLIALAAALIPMIRAPRRDAHVARALIAAGWQPFGGLAALSVGVLFATGLYSTGQQVASLDAMITTLYGRALLAKIGLFFGVGAVGLLNAALLHPRVARPLARLLRRPAGWTPVAIHHLPRLVLVELSLGLAVLLLTGTITAASAPRGVEYTVAAEDVPDALTEKIDDLLITLTANPNTPGQNVFTIFAASSRRPAPAEVLRVILRFTYQEQDLGRVTVNAEEIEPGRYMVTGNYLSLVGPWRVDVAVRRAGMEDAVASFDWVVAPPGNAQPRIISKYPLKTPLTLGGSLLLLAVLSIGAVVLRRRRRQRLQPAVSATRRFRWRRRPASSQPQNIEERPV